MVRTGPITALGLGAILGLLGVLVYYAVRSKSHRQGPTETDTTKSAG